MKLNIVLPLLFIFLSLSNLNAKTGFTLKNSVLDETQTVHKLVILDAAVPDKNHLYNDLGPGMQIVEFDPGSNGVKQLKETLLGYANLSAVHIISHAADGILFLGNSQITNETIINDSEFLSLLKGAIKEDGDLLLYGCDFAQGESDKTLSKKNHSQTEINIAASNDRTGSAALGGNWDLEVEAGRIKIGVIISREVQ